MVKLISLDLDGTLLDPASRITQETKDAIAQARKAGVRVVLNTGRSIQEGAAFAKEAGCDSLVSALGGAALADGEKGVVLRRWDMPEETATRALELCLNRNIELMIFAGEAILMDPFSKESLMRTFPSSVFHEAGVVTEDPVAYLKEHDLPLTKIHGDWNPGNYPLAELAALPGVQLTSANDHDFELVPAGVDKGKTLALLAMMYGLSLQDCAAVGDSENDLGMLRVVGTPIAMGNAAPQVKKAACRVAPGNAEEGVAWAIRSCLE